MAFQDYFQKLKKSRKGLPQVVPSAAAAGARADARGGQEPRVRRGARRAGARARALPEGGTALTRGSGRAQPGEAPAPRN